MKLNRKSLIRKDLQKKNKHVA